MSKEKDRKIRSGQSINTYSIGQIIPFPDNENLMLGSIELWDRLFDERVAQAPIGRIKEDDIIIKDAKRLQKLLGVKYFKKPFPYDNNLVRLPGIRFPRWHYCSRCGTMKKLPTTYQGNELECKESSCSQLKPFQRRLIPVRFVAVCHEGHIQDVPFDKWVHEGRTTGHKMKWQAGYGSGDLGSITIKCIDSNCDSSRSLTGLMRVNTRNQNDHDIYNSALASLGLPEENRNFSADNPNNNNPSGVYCSGFKPWLGGIGMVEGECKAKHLRVLIAGGSNVHYAKNKSSIYIPDISLKLNGYVRSKLEDQASSNLKIILEMDMDETVKKALLEKQIDTYFVQDHPTFSKEEIRKEVLKQISDQEEEEILSGIQEVDIRYEEYNYFLSENDNSDGDLVYETKVLGNYKNGSEFLKENFDSIVLIKKLKETRAFYGFSRVTPFDGNNISESKQMLVSDGAVVDWLPAIQVFGEGIFIKFSDEKLEKWLSKKPLTKRMEDSYHRAQENRNNSYERKDINPVFILLHTFAHLIIKRLCFNCGYGSSALREKIYFSSNDETKMNGILIYTSSGDSEGSLGGLVRQGSEKYLFQTIKDALVDAEWCSADPVCSDIGQQGQGPDNINGAACHNCCILPETSCEEFNGLLDRSIVVGSLGNKDLGYFNIESFYK